MSELREMPDRPEPQDHKETPEPPDKTAETERTEPRATLVTGVILERRELRVLQVFLEMMVLTGKRVQKVLRETPELREIPAKLVFQAKLA